MDCGSQTDGPGDWRVAGGGSGDKRGAYHSNPTTYDSPAGVAQLVEHQPSKLRVAGSSPVARSETKRVARVAQSVERILGKDEVTGSIPVASLDAIRYTAIRYPLRMACGSAMTDS